MEADGRLVLVPDYGDSDDDLSRDAVQTGFTVLLEIWHSALEELGGEVTPLQLRVLLIVSRARRVSLGRLADALGASVPATNRICTRMEAAGLVAQGRGAARGGIPMIVLTASGRRLVTRIQAQRGAVLDHVLESLTPAGRAALASALTELAAS
jgi:DNA-binding MarR family transcriptional regulator